MHWYKRKQLELNSVPNFIYVCTVLLYKEWLNTHPSGERLNVVFDCLSGGVQNSHISLLPYFQLCKAQAKACIQVISTFYSVQFPLHLPSCCTVQSSWNKIVGFLWGRLKIWWNLVCHILKSWYWDQTKYVCSSHFKIITVYLTRNYNNNASCNVSICWNFNTSYVAVFPSGY